MRILVNLDTHEVTLTPSTLKFKGASLEPVQIGFAVTGGSPFLFEGNIGIEFAITNSGAALAYLDNFSPGAGNYYEGLIDCSGTSLVALLATTSPSKLNAEVKWSIGSQSFRSQTFTVTLEKAEIPDGVASSADPTLYPPASDLFRKSTDVASVAEVNAGQDAFKIVTPATLSAALKGTLNGITANIIVGKQNLIIINGIISDIQPV